MDDKQQIDNTPEYRAMTPLCWACGWPMEWTGEYREIELDGGFAGVVDDPIYRCDNPDCYEDEEMDY